MNILLRYGPRSGTLFRMSKNESLFEQARESWTKLADTLDEIRIRAATSESLVETMTRRSHAERGQQTLDNARDRLYEALMWINASAQLADAASGKDGDRSENETHQ